MFVWPGDTPFERRRAPQWAEFTRGRETLEGHAPRHYLEVHSAAVAAAFNEQLAAAEPKGQAGNEQSRLRVSEVRVPALEANRPESPGTQI